MKNQKIKPLRFYHVKTRNWYAKPWVRKLLDLTPDVSIDCPRNPADHDVKYSFDGTSARVAWLVWLYWQALKPFSGGWTYIIRPGFNFALGLKGYKSIY